MVRDTRAAGDPIRLLIPTRTHKVCECVATHCSRRVLHARLLRALSGTEVVGGTRDALA